MSTEPCTKIYQPPVSIQITEQETYLFDTLLMALKSANKQTTTLRVAGGWVRDKLLGYISHDIDIAADNMTGVELGTVVTEYIAAQGDVVHKMGVVSQNPEKSKHLETACIKICGYDIDLVNLRAESYQENSRVPTKMMFGTPREDALRRDFTINALFYNINTGELEDFTDLGISDLNNKLIRTPLDCNITFYDDPLRILRAIRFSKRLGFKLDQRMYQVTKNKDLTSRLQIVSRQRYNKELVEILSGENAFRGLQGLFDMNVFSEVFLHILNVSMDKQLDLNRIFQRTMEVWKEYATAVQTMKIKIYAETLDIDIQAFYYLISLFSVGLAINEALRQHDTPSSIADISVAVNFLDESVKKKQSHQVMPVMWYISRICCASTNSIAETLHSAHMYTTFLMSRVLSPEQHISLFRAYNRHAVLLSLCALSLTPQLEDLIATYKLDNPAHLVMLLDAKLNVNVPQLASLCGVENKKMFSHVKEAAILCYLSDDILLQSLKEHSVLKPEFTFEYCKNKLTDIVKILQCKENDRKTH